MLRERAFDLAVLLPNSMNVAYTAWRAGIPERWGYRSDWRGAFLTRAVARPRRMHQAAAYQHLVRSLGCESGPSVPSLAVSAEVRQAGVDLLVASGWNGRTPLVALAVGAAYGGAKRWPARSFAELGASFGRDGVGVVLVGSVGDATAGAEVESGIRGATGNPSAAVSPINLIGRTDLRGLAGVLVTCRALVSNDSGAMHLGAALGVSVTAVFGPTDERYTRPLGSREPVVLTHPVWCRPCMLRECPIDHRCMRGVGVDRVLRAAERAF
jgi:heptosyltransferase-2